MIFFQKKDQVKLEIKKLEKQERRFMLKRINGKESRINKAFEGKVPRKLQETLDAAFIKAFSAVFEKGTGIIEKTYDKSGMKKTFLVNEYADEVYKTRKTLKEFSKGAGRAKAKNILISGVSGVGMGVIGVGVPDIPVFTAIMLKNIYETALSFGFDYETEDERRFILLIIQGAFSGGSGFKEIDNEINMCIEKGICQISRPVDELIKKAAESISKEILYMKFIQGIVVIGAVGGFFDAVYMKRIAEYAEIKYRKRFLSEKIVQRTDGGKK
ncbi:EcsC family protein [Anaerotignum faecicola]|nr:EcsC family protein [Anaerotignum faecicola]